MRALFIALALLALSAPARAEPPPPSPSSSPASTPPVWLTATDGSRFRVRFDPGHRFIFGTGVTMGSAASPGPYLELGLSLRSAPPPPDWEISWRRDHDLLHVRVHADGADGVLYRGTFLRRSREGTLTLPTAPPLAIPLPFDIGLAAEIGRVRNLGWSTAPGAPAPLDAATVVRGDVLADFLRSPHPGCWLAVGVGARYDVALAPSPASAAPGTPATALVLDHLVAPMTALSVTARGERRDGLLAAGIRAEGAWRWSSLRGWEPAVRADAELEALPLAFNDRPFSVFAAATAEAGGPLSTPELRAIAGLRLSETLR